MFSSTFTYASLALVLALQAQGHAIITPALNGAKVRNDSTQPSTTAPCGAGVNIAQFINTAQTVAVQNGNVDATIQNFNAGTDGSRFVTAQIDPTGTGKNFQAATVTTNGEKNPTDITTQPLVVKVPAGLKASGGATKNKMLVAFTTLGGFGNCVVATTNNAATTGTGKNTGKATGGKGRAGKNGGRGRANAKGRGRHARSLRAMLETVEEDAN